MIQWFRFYTNTSVIYSIVPPARAIAVFKFILMAVKFPCFWVCVCVCVDFRGPSVPTGCRDVLKTRTDGSDEWIDKDEGVKRWQACSVAHRSPVWKQRPVLHFKSKSLNFSLVFLFNLLHLSQNLGHGGGPVLYSDDVFDCVPFKQGF